MRQWQALLVDASSTNKAFRILYLKGWQPFDWWMHPPYDNLLAIKANRFPNIFDKFFSSAVKGNCPLIPAT